MTATPTDIPEDICEQARAVFATIATVDWIEAEIIIARAIFAERKRCAQIAINRAEHHREHCEPECKCANGWHVAIEIDPPNSARGFSNAEQAGTSAILPSDVPAANSQFPDWHSRQAEPGANASKGVTAGETATHSTGGAA